MAHLASGSAIVCVYVLTAVVLLRGLFVMSLWRVAPEPPRGLEAALINSCCSILPSPAQTQCARSACRAQTARDAFPCHCAHLFSPVELIF